MKFLVDQCTGPAVAKWLRSKGYEVFSVFYQARGAIDSIILAKTYAESWILITNDKDFGEMVYREKRPHHGIVFLRLQNQRSTVKIDALNRVLNKYENRLADKFVVVTESLVRFTSTLN
ncbi:MAG: DUF5615 family PIN-like protein [Cyanobacteria bacterium J06631_9]